MHHQVCRGLGEERKRRKGPTDRKNLGIKEAQSFLDAQAVSSVEMFKERGNLGDLMNALDVNEDLQKNFKRGPRAQACLLPYRVQRRIKALKNLQVKSAELEDRFHQEVVVCT